MPDWSGYMSTQTHSTGTRLLRRPPSPNVPPTHEDIATRAYELFVERGGEHGHDWEDWLSAEQELAATDADLRAEPA
jgi:hypothetical protein